MSVTGLEVFDATVQKTNAWLKRLMEILESDDRHLAYLALRATLHALRDRLTVEEAAELAAQLPMLVRGFYFEGWDPTGKPVRDRHLDAFLARIWRELPPGAPVDPEPAARAVFRLLAERIAEGELEDVRHVLPGEVRELWGDGRRGETVSASDQTVR
jgi:uncharacterized protein (DUF2267 family)